MAARVGIELSPSACRIVEIDGRPSWARRAGETRVRSFALLPLSGLETRATLQSLRRRTAVAVVWNAPSEHRQVVVTGGSYESMRAEALATLAVTGLQTQDVVADIAPVAGPPQRGVRQPVVVALASAPELASALQPLREAGIRLRAVTTPAVALGSLARQRRAFAVPGAIEAYVALEETVSCIALVRDSALVAAREIAWGYAENASGAPRSRDEIAARLADAVLEFVGAIGGEQRDIGQVCVCGALPELRSMTLPLMERLDVEVEPLDSMFGIDIAHVPEPADEFRERTAELRLAWAVAADWPPPINLLRPQRRRASKAILARAAVAAGVVAGLAVGWRVERSEWWRSTAPKPQTRTATTAAPRGPAASQPPALRATPPPDVGPKPPPPAGTSSPAVAQSRPPVAPPPDVGPKLPTVVTPPREEPARSLASPPRVAPVIPPSTAPAATATPAPPPVVRAEPLPTRAPPPPAARTAPATPARTEPAPRRVEPPPVRAEPPAVRIVSPPVPTEMPPRSEPATARPAPAQARAKAAPQELALPFDAALGTILFSPDRKLAIIDGRIVGPGDDVRGARVIDITPTAVLLRDAQGRLRRLALAPGGP